MSILIVANNDWANLGYEFALSCGKAGGKAEALKLRPHPFAYHEEAEIVTKEEMHARAKNYDTVLFMHSQFFKGMVCERKAVFHGGSAYRRNPQKMNGFWNSIVDITFVQTGDFLGLGAKHERWLMPPVNTSYIKPKYHSDRHTKIIAHFPRGINKGTETITSIVNGLRVRAFHYMTSNANVPWRQNLKRMSECDIYIESINPSGEFGITALEAAALGKIVITNFKSAKLYEKEYGLCPFFIANDSKELKFALEKVLDMTNAQILRRQQATRQWVVKYHSRFAIGRRLLDGIKK